MSKQMTGTGAEEWLFSGEQYAPSVRAAEISYEHWHRYFLATEFVKDKLVLDIACGEGYGSHLMSQHARRVVGVDANGKLIEHARAKYVTDDSGRIEFRIGRAGSIPVSGEHIFDVAVSYETIEHLDEQEQADFLSELKRLVKPQGLILISTPNKLFYSDIPVFHNEFHVKEFYAEEFEHFLCRYFANVSVLNQRVRAVSHIWSHAEPNDTFREYRMRDDGTGFAPTDDSNQGIFMIALCSEAPLPKHASSIMVDLSHRLVREKDELIALQRAQLADVMHQLETVLNSKFYKLTKPLRFLRKLSRRFLCSFALHGKLY